ncbi:MAG TPA: carboxypeptidase-like regulatory domain-containing protein [Planctomycetota bacterium]
MVKALVLAVPWLAGCGPCFYQQLVYVTDDEGRPVEGAKVWVAYASFNERPSATNADGIAPVSMGSLFTVYGVQASADGLVSAELTGRPSRWPVEITLRRPSSSYEVIAVFVRQRPLSEGGTGLSTGDADPRFFVEFAAKKVLRGTPPELLHYIVHSPALFLRGKESGEFRVSGEVVDDRGRKIHRVRVFPAGP